MSSTEQGPAPGQDLIDAANEGRRGSFTMDMVGADTTPPKTDDHFPPVPDEMLADGYGSGFDTAAEPEGEMNAATDCFDDPLADEGAPAAASGPPGSTALQEVRELKGTALHAAMSLLPVLARLDQAEGMAQGKDDLQAILEGYLMVDAVARSRRFKEQALQAEAGVTRLRTRIGKLQEDAREGRSGKTLANGNVLTTEERVERAQNKRLAEIGPERVAAISEDLVAEGRKPTARNVIAEADKDDKPKAPAPEPKPPATGTTRYPADVPHSDEWYTPERVIEAARAAMGTIDLDPASCEEANQVVKATRYIALPQDGLKVPWEGWVWCNPPYSQGQQWVEKVVSEFRRIGGSKPAGICLLLNAATETRWAQMAMSTASVICFPAGRLRFWGPNERAGGSPQVGQMVLYYGSGKSPAKFAEAFKDTGSIHYRTPRQ